MVHTLFRSLTCCGRFIYISQSKDVFTGTLALGPWVDRGVQGIWWKRIQTFLSFIFFPFAQGVGLWVRVENGGYLLCRFRAGPPALVYS